MSLRNAKNFSRPRADVLITPPTSEPVMLRTLKHHLKIENTDEDEYIDGLISTAREWIEEMTGIAMITQTWRMTMDRWPDWSDEWWDGVRELPVSELYGGNPSSRSIELSRYPLASVTSMTVYDEASNATVVSLADTFDIDTDSQRGRITLKSGVTWPSATRPTNAIEIVYVAGYGDLADVPDPLRRAVLNMANYLYLHRGDGCSEGEAYMKSGAAGIANRYRIARL